MRAATNLAGLQSRVPRDLNRRLAGRALGFARPAAKSPFQPFGLAAPPDTNAAFAAHEKHELYHPFLDTDLRTMSDTGEEANRRNNRQSRVRNAPATKLSASTTSNAKSFARFACREAVKLPEGATRLSREATARVCARKSQTRYESIPRIFGVEFLITCQIKFFRFFECV